MQTQSPMIKVWDPLVRVFHWTLVVAFLTAYVTEEDFLSIHSFAGYTVFGLLLFRIIWGFIGTRHARFRDFVYSPATIKQFIKDTLLMRARRYIGHNPAGGAMIILMIASLLITTVSGMAVYGAEEQLGPMANWFSHGLWGDIFEELHEFFANFTLLLVLVHVSGVVFESLVHRENLAKSMITGLKHAEASGEQNTHILEEK